MQPRQRECTAALVGVVAVPERVGGPANGDGRQFDGDEPEILERRHVPDRQLADGPRVPLDRRIDVGKLPTERKPAFL